MAMRYSPTPGDTSLTESDTCTRMKGRERNIRLLCSHLNVEEKNTHTVCQLLRKNIYMRTQDCQTATLNAENFDCLKNKMHTPYCDT